MGSSRLMRGAPLNIGELRAIPVLGIRDVFAGDSVAVLVVDALALGGLRFHDGDILVVKHKIVSDRKSTRLNSSHLGISYAVFCLKKKKKEADPALIRGTDGQPLPPTPGPLLT